MDKNKPSGFCAFLRLIIMNIFRGFRAILYKEFIVMFRDRTTLFFMFFPPLVQIIAFGFALDNDVKHMAMVVYDEDRTFESRQLIDAFVNTQTFRVVKTVDSSNTWRFVVPDSAYCWGPKISRSG